MVKLSVDTKALIVFILGGGIIALFSLIDYIFLTLLIGVRPCTNVGFGPPCGLNILLGDALITIAGIILSLVFVFRALLNLKIRRKWFVFIMGIVVLIFIDSFIFQYLFGADIITGRQFGLLQTLIFPLSFYPMYIIFSRLLSQNTRRSH